MLFSKLFYPSLSYWLYIIIYIIYKICYLVNFFIHLSPTGISPYFLHFDVSETLKSSLQKCKSAKVQNFKSR